MDLIKSYMLVENKDGYDLILYLDTGIMDVEFAGELGSLDKENTKLKQNIIQQISQKFPNLKINTVKIMVGTLMLASFFMGMPVAAQAGVATSGGAAQAQSAYNYNVNISIDGKAQTFQNRPMIYNDITYVPLSEFGKAIGAQVWWNGTSNTVGINKNGVSVAFKRGSTVARVNGVQKSMPVSVVIGDTTYAPLKFIAQNFGYTVAMNSSTRTVNVTSSAAQNKYTVLAGDSLWKISQKFGISVDNLKKANNLTSDNILAGQTLVIPKSSAAPSPSPAPAPASKAKWPDVTYIVQPGDTDTSISKKFGVPAQDIMKYNYMSANDWFDAGDKIAISGYAPRVYTVTRGQASAPAQRGAPVDWVLEGQYLVKRNAVFTLVDVDTGKQFKVKMIGGYNHIDIEPLTASDTAAMKSLFDTWKWSPRAVVIYIDGMNLAASLSGMPHDVDTIADNGVTGHFDLYMKNSSPHSGTASTAYTKEHAVMVAKAAGQ
jgi:LysM repeat protein